MSDVKPIVMSLHNPDFYFNRELSWLAFNERVLEEAMDENNPLLERLKFLAIFSTNLDEFMMIRYAGLKDQADAGIDQRTPDGMTPKEQLKAISEKLHPLVALHRKVLGQIILPALENEGVSLLAIDKLKESDKAVIEKFFRDELFPVLTPLAVDSGHPFPRLPNLSFSLMLEVDDPVENETKMAIVQVPSVLQRFLRLPGKDGYRFVMLEDIIKAKLSELFPGYEVKRAHAFRLTRNADIEIAEDEADDLLQVIEDEVRRRRWGDPVRLEVMSDMPKSWRTYLRETNKLNNDDVYEIPNHLNVADFMELASLKIADLRDKPFVPRLPTEYRNQNIFAAIHKQDILIQHPFHAFDAVQDLIEEAADDPNVLAIKQTLYRVGRKSPVVTALMKAAGNGKLVTALVELKARFDEENNIVWARELERSGVHVVYGFAGLKTHCKALLIVRREGKDIKRYVHLGTGNYNPGTASVYTDLALLSCDPDLGADVSELFNYLTGFSKQTTWRKLWVAPKICVTKLLKRLTVNVDLPKLAKKPTLSLK